MVNMNDMGDLASIDCTYVQSYFKRPRVFNNFLGRLPETRFLNVVTFDVGENCQISGQQNSSTTLL
jgi:hypothetical protein